MKPLPDVVLQLLLSLPEETSKIILNTNREGHWEIEVFTRYRLDEPPSQVRAPLSYRPAKEGRQRSLT
jgi:hypothetical protein